jgi:ADP-ribose pyrophosphatase
VSRVYPAILSRETTRLSPWVELVKKTVQFGENEVPEVYHFITQADYVHVLAQIPDGRIPIVRQYRPCVEDFTWEFPAGTLDPGEQPAAAAVREVLEETGLRTSELIDLGTYFPDTGRVEVTSHAFYARCAEAPEQFISSEGLAVKFVSHQELKGLMQKGEFRHQLHVGLYAAALVRGIDLG